MDTVRTVVHVFTRDRETLEAEAAKRGCSMSFILRGLLRDWAASKERVRAKHGNPKAALARKAKPKAARKRRG